MVLIGGLAVILHGGDHVTQDADFAFSRKRENAKLIVQALAPFHPRPWQWPEELPFVWDDQTLMNSSVLTLQTDIGRIDLLAEPSGSSDYLALRSRALDVEINGRVVPVASIDDLIAMKRAAGRPKDLAHIAELETIKKLMLEKGV